MTWSDLFLLGAIAGGPTCIGTLLSGAELSAYFTVACYAVAAGSLLSVVFALVALSYTATRRLQMAQGTFVGVTRTSPPCGSPCGPASRRDPRTPSHLTAHQPING